MTRKKVLIPDRIDRSEGIGSSDIPAIAGLSRFKTPFDVWLEKTQRAPAEIDSEGLGRDPKFWGKALERKITEVYAKREKRSLVYLFDEPRRHPRDPWHLASPDAHDEEVVVDAKNIGLSQAFAFGEDGSDDIPEEYVAQGAWQMAVLGLKKFDLAALIGGQELRIFHLEWNGPLEDALREIGFRFWRDHVQADTPPPVEESEKTKAYFRSRFGREKFTAREATMREIDLVRELARVQIPLANLTKRNADLRMELKLSIGDAVAIEGPDFEVSSKANRDSQITDWKAAFVELRNSYALVAGNLPPWSDKSPDQLVADFLQELVAKHTTTRPGARPLTPKFLGALQLTAGGNE